MSGQSSPPTVDEVTFRRALSQFATGVKVVTTTVDGDRHGMTANAFTSVSVDPPLVLVCLDHDSQMRHLVERAGSLTITFLAEGQRDLSDRFARPGRRPDRDVQFDGVAWRPGPVFGHPVLVDGLAYLDCAVEAVHAAGDHTIVVAAVRDTGILEGADPLLFFRSGYRRISPS